MYISRDDKLFDKVCLPIYRELFKLAEPSADFDAMMKSGETKKDNFFMKYYLLDDTTRSVIEKHIKAMTKKLRIRKYEQEKIRVTVMLGCSPTGALKRWKKETKQ